MRQVYPSTFRGKESSTLVVLLIVIAMMGILSGMLFSALNSARQKGRDISCKSNLKQIGLALQQYPIDFSDYHCPAILFCHRIARMHLLLGADEVSVSGRVGCANSIDVPGDCVLSIRYANGGVGLLHMRGYRKLGAGFGDCTRVMTTYGFVGNIGTQLQFSDQAGNLTTQPVDEDANYTDYKNFYLGFVDSLADNAPFAGDGQAALRDVAVVLAGIKSSKKTAGSAAVRGNVNNA